MVTAVKIEKDRKEFGALPAQTSALSWLEGSYQDCLVLIKAAMQLVLDCISGHVIQVSQYLIH